ncbi:MAG: hypothetical protein M0Z58_01115 [Nitrospiraceae bacterium]|nr:hypothetical protein [Nitrospiraceae bacterium]
MKKTKQPLFRVFCLAALMAFVCPPAWAGGNFTRGEWSAEVFGRKVTVRPGNPRYVSAWDAGFDLSEPPPGNYEILPVGDVYIWRHPDSRSLFRADLSGVWDDVFWARRLKGLPGPFEGVLTFKNFTIPAARSELVDGEELKSEALLWGYVRPGFGIGYRRQVPPGHESNMLAADLIFEPGFLFFARGSDTADNFVAPRDTFEFRTRLELRWDALNRNLLRLPQKGYAAGADLVYGYRADWRDWGVNGAEAAGEGKTYASFTGYFLAAGGVPWVKSKSQRLVGAIHAGSGYRLDRFSAARVGGGPDPLGEEYGSTYLPVLPGAVIQEFFPEHYVLATGEYRWQPFFFACLGVDASAGWLDRLRRTDAGIVKKNDLLPAVGVRLITGFFFDTRLQIAYNYNFSVVRNGGYGGHEFLMEISGNL